MSLTSPVTSSDVISPDDVLDLPHVTRAIYVGLGGNLVVRMLSGDEATLMNVQPGVLYPLRASRVLETGTTAAGLVGLY